MKLYRKIIDYRLTMTSSADAVGKQSNSIVTIVFYGYWKKSVYLFGKRVLTTKS